MHHNDSRAEPSNPGNEPDNGTPGKAASEYCGPKDCGDLLFVTIATN